MTLEDLERAVLEAKAAEEKLNAGDILGDIERSMEIITPAVSLSIEMIGARPTVATLVATLVNIIPHIPDADVREAIGSAVNRAVKAGDALDKERAAAKK